MCGMIAAGYGLDRQWFQDLRLSGLERQYEEGTQIIVTGILSEKKETEDGWKFCLEKLKYQGIVTSREKVLVYLSKDNAGRIPGIGQWLTVSGKISFYQDAPNPGNFNQKFYYQKRRIHACVKQGKMEQTVGSTDKFREGLWKLGRALKLQILKNTDGKQGQILSAMLLGSGQEAEELTELYQKAGIGHLLAISGLHVSFLGMGIYRMLRKIGTPGVMAAAIGIGILASYVEMCGAGVSARRAFWMFVVRMGAEVTGRVYDQINSLSIAAIIILAEQPLWLIDTGFLLSFGAIFAFAVLLPALEREGKKNRMLPAVALQMVICPVMMYAYYEISPWSVVWNLLVIPIAPVIFASGLGGGMTGLFSSCAIVQKAARLISRPAFWGLSFYETGSRLCLKLPLSRMITGRPAGWKLVFYAVSTMVFVIVRFIEKQENDSAKEGKKGRWMRRLRCLAGGASLTAVCLLMIPERIKHLEITMLDVGQGDCFIIQNDSGKTYMVDGGSTSVSSVGKYRIESWMKYRGIRQIDTAFLSHGDEDHMAGIEEMLERQTFGIPVIRVIVPQEKVWDEKIRDLISVARREGTKVSVMEQDKKIKDKKLLIECLGPDKDMEEPGNEASMILSVQYEDFSMLFTGDVENEGEKRLIKNMEQKQKTGDMPSRYTVLKCAHHGSRNSSTDRFLQKIRPEVVLISAGDRNERTTKMIQA